MKKLSYIFISFFIISLLSILYSVYGLLRAYQINDEKNRITEAALALNQLKRDSNGTYIIQKELNRFYVMLSENKCTDKEIEGLCVDFNKSGYKFIKLRFFNKKHNPVSIRNYDDNDILNGAMQRLYSALATYKLNNDDTLLKRYKSLFETLLGAVDLYKLAKETSTLIPITLSGKPGYLYWNVYENEVETHDIGGMVAWLKNSDIPSKTLCHNTVDKYNEESAAKKSDQIFGFVDANTNGYMYPENIITALPNFHYNDLFLKLQELNACLKSHDKTGSYIFNYVDLGNNRYFFCLTTTISDNVFLIIFISFSLILLLPSIYFGYLFFKIIKVIENSEKVSLVKHITATSTISIIIFILFLIIINVFTEKIAYSNKKDQKYESLVSVLEWIDEGFTLSKKELADKWLTFSRDENVKILNKDSIDNIIKEYSKEDKVERVYITDGSGKILYSYSDGNDNIFNKIIPVVAKKIATERFGTEDSWKSLIEKQMLETFSQTFTDLIGESATNILKAFEHFDTFSELELGNKRHLVFSTIIENSRNTPMILIVWLDSQHFSHDYLLNKIKDSQMLPENLRTITLAMVPIHLDSQPFPPEITKYSFSRDITERVTYTKRTVNFETSAGGQNFFGVGTILHSIPNYVVFAVQGD